MKNLTSLPLFFIFFSSFLNSMINSLLPKANNADKAICEGGDSFLGLVGLINDTNYYLCGNSGAYQIFKENKEYSILFFSLSESESINSVYVINDFLFIILLTPTEIKKGNETSIQPIDWKDNKLTCEAYGEILYCLIEKDKIIALGAYDDSSKEKVSISLLSDKSYSSYATFTMKMVNTKRIAVCYIMNLITFCAFEEIEKTETQYTLIKYSFTKLLIVHYKDQSNFIIGGQIQNEAKENQVAIVSANEEGGSEIMLIIDKDTTNVTFTHQNSLVDSVSYVYNEEQTNYLGKTMIAACQNIKIGSNIKAEFSIGDKYPEGFDTQLIFDSFSIDGKLELSGETVIIGKPFRIRDSISATEILDDFIAIYHLGDSALQCTIKIHSCFENCKTCNQKGTIKENKCLLCANKYYPSIKKGNCEKLSDDKYVTGEKIIKQCPIQCASCNEKNGFVKCLSCKQPNIFLTEDGNCLNQCPNEETADNKCNLRCPVGEELQGDTCVPCTEPKSKYYEEVCYPKCPLNTFEYNNKCYQQCPLGTITSILERICQPCPDKEVFFQNYCLSFCPEGYSSFTNTEFSICKKCEDPNPYYYRGRCLQTCPENQESTSFICSECNGFIQEDYNCIEKCPNDFNKFNQCTLSNPSPEIDPKYSITFHHNPLSKNNKEIVYFQELPQDQQQNQIRDLSQKILTANSNYSNYDYTLSLLSDIVLFHQIVSIGNIEPTLELFKMIEEINKKELGIISSADIKAMCFYLGDEFQIISMILLYSSLNNKANAADSFDSLYQLSSTYLENYITEINNLDKDGINQKVYDDYLSDVLSGTTNSVSKQIEILREVPKNDFNKEEAISPKYQMTNAIITNESYLSFRKLIEKVAETMMSFKETPASKTPNYEIANTQLKDSSSSKGIVQSNCDLTDYNKLIDKMKEQKLTKLVCLPDNLISQYPSLDSGHVGVIDYSLYPLLNKNISALSNDFFSIRLFTKDNQYVPLKKLSEPIAILMMKPNSSYNECIFYNEELKTPNNTDCVSMNIEPYLICTCTHLTDFSLSMFHPVNIFKDIIKLFEQARFITSWEAFKYLNSSNATVLYFFCAIFLLFLIGLVITIRLDLKSGEDLFVMMIDKESSCCSKEDIEEEIDSLRDKTLELITIRKLVSKYFLKEGKNTQEKNKMVLAKFNIKLKEPSEDPSIEMKENQTKKIGHNACLITNTIDEKPKQNSNLIENEDKSDDINTNNEQNEPLLKTELNTEVKEDSTITNENKNHLVSLTHINTVCPTENKQDNNNTKTEESDAKLNIFTEVNKKQKLKMSLIPKKEENDKAPLKNHWFLSLFYVFKEFFLNEYRVCVLLFNKENVYTRSNIVILTVIRLVAAISICALFSKCVPAGEDDDEIEKGFSNRNLAVSISTILIMEIPFTFFEILLLKTKIPQKKIDTK